MKMEPWQERVIQEKKELDEKIEKLKKFIKNAPEKLATETEMLRLEVQFTIMQSYSNILDVRIKSWEKPNDNG
jgi:hypothetical protein